MTGQASASEVTGLVVCPNCLGELRFSPVRIRCIDCGVEYGYENGFPNLILGGRFDDAEDPDRTQYEITSNHHLASNFLRPLFLRMFPDPSRARLLSLGCGVGIDIDVLAEARFQVFGIDCGNRASSWPQRAARDRFYLANGKHLPFRDSTFDLVYCGCVFPHVGVEGDSNRVTQTHGPDRLQVAREMTRVLKPGGRVLVSSPNRLFPLDLFHGRSPSQPYPRWNAPGSRFLLSAADYRRLFTEAGCDGFQALPVAGYWAFHRVKRTWKGRLLAFPVEMIFQMVSMPQLAFLRTWPISPWLVLLIRKANLV